MPKYKEIKPGDIFTLNGVQYIFYRIEKETIVLKVRHTGKQIIYGLEAFKRIMKQNGYEIKENNNDRS